jgi:hypothetical protein
VHEQPAALVAVDDAVGRQLLDAVELHRRQLDVATAALATGQRRHADATGAGPDVLVLLEELGRHGLRGFGPLMRGWAQFAVTCSLGLLTNVGSAAVLKTIGIHSAVAVVTGIVLGSVWNFALSSKFVWGKY